MNDAPEAAPPPVPLIGSPAGSSAGSTAGFAAGFAAGPLPETVDVLIVGGGLAGLTAAATAARAGARTMLVDPRPFGGRARTTTVDPGVVFNAGPRALYLGGAGHRVLTELGVSTRGGMPPLQPAALLVDGRREVMPTGPIGLLRTRALSRSAGGGPGARARLARLLATVQRVDTTALVGLSLEDWLDRERLTGAAAALVRSIVRLATYVDAPDVLAADAAVGQLQLALGDGVRYLDGGWQQLVDGLSSAAASAGADLRCGIGVHSVDRGPRGWVVRTHSLARDTMPPGTSPRSTERDADSSEAPGGTTGVEIRARAVVIAVGTPAAAASLSPVDIGIDRLGPPATAACLELAVSRPPELQLLLGLDEPLYLARHAPPARLAQRDGIDVVHVVRYGATSAAADREQLRAHAAMAGITSESIVAERFLARMVVAGGIPVASAGGLPGRPPVAVEGADGLFLAGDWVGPVGFLADASFASGSAAGKAAAADWPSRPNPRSVVRPLPEPVDVAPQNGG